MKRFLPLLILFISVGFSQQEYNVDHIMEQDGIYYKKFSDEIVNGKVYEMRGDMKVSLGKMKDGKKDGKWIEWYNNGRKKEDGNWKNGKKYGLWTTYMEDGWKLNEIKYTDDDNYEYKNYNKDGSLNYSGVHKDGKIFSGVLMSIKKGESFLDGMTLIHHHYENGKIMEMVHLDFVTKDTLKVEDCTKGECEEMNEQSEKSEVRQYIESIRPFGLRDILLRTYGFKDKLQNIPQYRGDREKFVPYDDPPQRKTEIKPDYPESAKDSGAGGTIILQVYIDEKGRVRACEILKGVSLELDIAAIKAVYETDFKPAKQRGKPVGAYLSIPIVMY